MARDQSLRRFCVLLLVTGVHVLLLLLPLDAERRERGGFEGDARKSQLFFLRLPIVERRLQRDLPQLAEPEIQTNIEITAPGAITVVSPSRSPATGLETGPSIDWSEEARRSAAAVIGKAPHHDRTQCDATGLADPALPNCKPAPQFKWAPPRAGFDGGLPYIRLGDRCVLGLGFFGCGLGTPPANGKLFDGMDDPDRDRSSVPENPGSAGPGASAVNPGTLEGSSR